MKCDSRCFVSSLLIDDHPMIHVKFKLKALYYSVLEYIVGQIDQSEETIQRLDQYKTQLLKNKAYKYNPKIDADNAIMSLSDRSFTCISPSLRMDHCGQRIPGAFYTEAGGKVKA